MAFLMRERGILILITLFLVLSNAPYLYAAFAAPSHAEFLGSFYNAIDTSVYLAAMREGARGDWLRVLPFTLEPHPAALFYPLYLLLGHLAPPTIVTYHIATLLASAVMCGGAWLFVREILTDQWEVRLAMLLGLLSLGLGWPTILMGLSPAVHPTDFYAPESTLFMTALVNPHFPFAAGMEFVTLALYARLRHGRARGGTLFLCALACLTMSLTQPYNLVIVVCIFALDVTFDIIRTRRLILPSLWLAAWVSSPSVPIAVYYFVWFHYAPFWADLVSSWPRPIVFTPLDYLLGYLPLALLAVAGAYWLIRAKGRTAGEQLLLAWLLANAAIILSPLDFAERTTLGFSLALATLASTGVWRVLLGTGRLMAGTRISSPVPERKLTAVLFAIMTIPLLLQIASAVAVAQRTADLPFYLPSDDAAAIRWLAANTTADDVVLASPSISNVVPGLTDARVYSGHPFETWQYPQKNDMVKQFFGSSMSEAGRREFLAANHIGFVYVQPGARGMGPYDGHQSDYMRPAFSQGAITIYRVDALALNTLANQKDSQ